MPTSRSTGSVLDRTDPAVWKTPISNATSETLTNAETWGKRAYQSPPDDPKEGDDVFDVFSLATGTGINGRPYKEW